MVAALAIAGGSAGWAQDYSYFEPGHCSLSQSAVNNVLGQLAPVVALPDANGGLFKPNKMWAAVVDRKGVLCAVTRSDADAFPASRDIAIAKAFTATGSATTSLLSRPPTSMGRRSRAVRYMG
jgi:hypothetical protein